MRVLGIDCGGQATGLGLIESDGRRHRVLLHAVVRAAAGEGFPQRLQRIHAAITEAIREHGPEWVAIEDIFYAENVRSALQLGHVRGVAMQAAAAQGVAVAEYTPLAVKSALTGYGRAAKEQVRHMVARLLGIAEKGLALDASDALAVAICHVHHSGTGSRLRGARAPGARPPRSSP